MIILFAGMELIILLLAVVLLLFGAKKIPDFARNLGKAKAEFERGKLMVEKEIRQMEKETKEEERESEKKKSESKIVKAAKDLGIDTEGKTETEIKEEIAALLAEK